MIQARCCPAYSISSFWISGCTFLGTRSTASDQLQLTWRPCAAMYHPGAFTWEKFVGSPFAKLSKWWPLPIWSSGSKAELSDQQGSEAGNCREKRGYSAKWQPWAFFSYCVSLVFLQNFSRGAENLHNYFLKVDVRCLQIVKGFCQLPYSCVGCCANTAAE